MKKSLTLLVSIVLLSLQAKAQSEMKEHKAGHIFYVSVPDYMSRTIGLNSSAVIQFKNAVKDVYGIVIEDDKDDLVLADLKYSSLTEFYESFIKGFVKEEDKRTVSKPVFQQKGSLNFVEADVTYYDKDAKTEIYYLVGIVETKFAYYKVLSWSAAESKEKFKADFQKILYSIKD
jgi:hypothetical protein